MCGSWARDTTVSGLCRPLLRRAAHPLPREGRCAAARPTRAGWALVGPPQPTSLPSTPVVSCPLEWPGAAPSSVQLPPERTLLGSSRVGHAVSQDAPAFLADTAGIRVSVSPFPQGGGVGSRPLGAHEDVPGDNLCSLCRTSQVTPSFGAPLQPGCREAQAE